MALSILANNLLNPTSGQATGAQEAANNAQPVVAPAAEDVDSILRDDAVTLIGSEFIENPSQRLTLDEYRNSVGQDQTFVSDTLRKKLAEFNLNPRTRIALSQDTTGNLQVEARIPPDTRDQLEQDLNNNQRFRDAFARLSQNQPTLNYVDNVTRLNKVYGAENSIFNSLVSQDTGNNSLNDLATRFENLKRNLVDNTSLESAVDRGFRLQLNV